PGDVSRVEHDRIEVRLEPSERVGPPSQGRGGEDQRAGGEHRVMTRGKLIVISGPSGVGKTSICDRLLEDPRFRRVVTCTTRPPRETEVPGVDYHFLGREEFEQ